MSETVPPEVVQQIAAKVEKLCFSGSYTDELQAFGEECARLALQAQGWQPMETAPAGRGVLLFVPAWPNDRDFGHSPAMTCRAFLTDAGWFWTYPGVWAAMRSDGPQPTHWRDEPAPPEPREERPR